MGDLFVTAVWRRADGLPFPTGKYVDSLYCGARRTMRGAQALANKVWRELTQDASKAGVEVYVRGRAGVEVYVRGRRRGAQ